MLKKQTVETIAGELRNFTDTPMMTTDGLMTTDGVRPSILRFSDLKPLDRCCLSPVILEL